MSHRYDVERDERLEWKWRLVCRDCDYVGEWVEYPSAGESKRLVAAFETHKEEPTHG